MDVFLIALPGLLLSSISVLPLGLGTLAASRHMRAGARSGYLRNLNASIAAGAVVLLLLWGSLFGDDLSRSSTAGLIFLFAPIYSAAAQVIVYAISSAAVRKSVTPAVSVAARRALMIPLCILAVLLIGLVKTSVKGNDLAVAERASNPDTLRRLFERSRSGEADSFGVPIFLAQNPNTPPDILAELAKHSHPAVRVQVAQNPRTPQETVAGLSNDCSSFVRNAVEKRLMPNKKLLPTYPPSGGCAAER